MTLYRLCKESNYSWIRLQNDLIFVVFSCCVFLSWRRVETTEFTVAHWFRLAHTKSNLSRIDNVSRVGMARFNSHHGLFGKSVWPNLSRERPSEQKWLNQACVDEHFFAYDKWAYEYECTAHFCTCLSSCQVNVGWQHTVCMWYVFCFQCFKAFFHCF